MLHDYYARERSTHWSLLMDNKSCMIIMLQNAYIYMLALVFNVSRDHDSCWKYYAYMIIMLQQSLFPFESININYKSLLQFYKHYFPPWFDRVKHGKSAAEKSNQSFFLILVIATLYCMWCASQIYLRQPPQPAIGEEADLGVIIFLAIYLFLPHGLCVLSMNQKDYTGALNELPLR